jgi:hypothetical protein
MISAVPVAWMRNSPVGVGPDHARSRSRNRTPICQSQETGRRHATESRERSPSLTAGGSDHHAGSQPPLPHRCRSTDLERDGCPITASAIDPSRAGNARSGKHSGSTVILSRSCGHRFTGSAGPRPSAGPHRSAARRYVSEGVWAARRWVLIKGVAGGPPRHARWAGTRVGVEHRTSTPRLRTRCTRPRGSIPPGSVSPFEPAAAAWRGARAVGSRRLFGWRGAAIDDPLRAHSQQQHERRNRIG